MPRTKGAKDLSGQEKAQIIAQKNTKLYNHQKIADNFNISSLGVGMAVNVVESPVAKAL